MTENFWLGFEKRAAGPGFIRNMAKTVAGAGKDIGQWGSNLATKAGKNEHFTRGLGNMARGAGQLIERNPRMAAGIGAGATIYGGHKILS